MLRIFHLEFTVLIIGNVGEVHTSQLAMDRNLNHWPSGPDNAALAKHGGHTEFKLAEVVNKALVNIVRW